MTYDIIIKYIFDGENQNYDTKDMRWRKREFIAAKYLSMVFGRHFLNLTDKELTLPFGNDHSSFHNAKKQIQNLYDTDKFFAQRYDKYFKELSKQINLEKAIANKEVNEPGKIASRRWNNNVLQLESVLNGYVMRRAYIEEEKEIVEETKFSFEEMRSICETYCEIHDLVVGKKI